MDFLESSRIVISRIQKLEPDNVSKIFRYIMMQENAERELLRLAHCPDSLIQSLINTAKTELNLKSNGPSTPVSIGPISPTLVNTSNPFIGSRSFSSPPTFQVPPPPYWEHPQLPSMHGMDFVPSQYQDSLGENYHHLHNNQSHHFEDHLDAINPVPEFQSGLYYPVETALGPRASRRSPSLPEFPVKPCIYYHKGYCKHGDNCRFFHGQEFPESFSQIFSSNSKELDDQLLSHWSLEKLEMEITELLKDKRGAPISIAVLPSLYYEKYGKNLQAEGYLTESQRHGKAGFNLTKLLMRLKKNIRVIDKPHGQHSVVLAEDVPRFMGFRIERNDPGAASKQIYLTFPPESTFTEEDVSNYFTTFGPVHDVRIPCQQKRMYGFVTFEHAETAKMILEQARPHYVCGARVLVKKYMEKSRLDRRHMEKFEPPVYCPHYLDMASDLPAMSRVADGPRFLRKQIFDDQELSLEFERRRMAQLQLLSKQQAQQPFYAQASPVEELNLQEGQNEVQSSNGYYLFDAINCATTNDIKFNSSNFSDQDSSQAVNLPESPFASTMGSSTTVV
ncbi:Zinc finger CCCH domain-containing protein 18 [Acorus calamus]|uniref:Zinc finger CCCH domain-containing protein 18 n=1 Tax=Acorus calamus TaxID=4465 RepID=A0AAV9CTR9_ACOCL|nr:Zinc finger CCCH domain-containing protein 18 [Acorus calamus]